MLRFHIFSTRYTVLQTKMPLQSIQPPWKIWTIPNYKREAMHRATVNLTPWTVSKKNWDTEEEKSIIHVFYVLWYAKRHI